jgi:hypothetical protein
MHLPGIQSSALKEYLASKYLCKATTHPQGTDLSDNEADNHPDYDTHRETELQVAHCEPTLFDQQQQQ